MGSSKWGLTSFCFLVILTLFKIVESSTVFGPANEQVVDSKIPELQHDQALQLCRKMNDTLIPDLSRYLWAYIHSDKELHSIEKRDVSRTKSHLTVVPACTVYKWRFCGGTTRYPLADECGFFEATSQSNCVGTERKANPEHPIVMPHDQAMDLCSIVNQMPENTNEPHQVKFLPIRLELDANAKNYLSKSCVVWKFIPCGNGGDDVFGTTKCGEWHPVTVETQECRVYGHALNKLLKMPVTTAIEHGNDSLDAQDFFQSPPGNELHNLDEDSTSVEDPEMMSVLELVHCRRLESSVSCTVLPRSSLRFKRAAHSLRVQRSPQFFGSRRYQRICNCKCFPRCKGLRYDPGICADCKNLESDYPSFFT